ncbi:MAG: polysaccharide deacetylase family protein [Proteobacteria bacterium]|nr:polysaccharide deacetylase family protein [Pseudomonadota bacterium]
MRQLASWESWLLRAGAGALSRRSRAAALLVLIYHRVLPRLDPLQPGEPDAADFARQMDLLAGSFRVLPLREAVARLSGGTLPARSVCITFDDGYANNYEIALPILAARGLPATVFVACGYLDGGRMFNDTVIESVRQAPVEFDLGALALPRFRLTDDAARGRAIDAIIAQLKYLPVPQRNERALAVAAAARATLPDDLMMTSRQLRALHAAGIEIGAHTVNHPILTQVDAATARREIMLSRQRLEELTGAAVRSFAYPNGRPQRDYGVRDVALVREAGFDLALSTSWGVAGRSSDLLQLPRVAPGSGTDARRFGARLALAYRQRACATV